MVFLYKGVERYWVTPYLILILYAGLKVITLLVLSDRYVVLKSLEVFHSCFTSILQNVIHSIYFLKLKLLPKCWIYMDVIAIYFSFCTFIIILHVLLLLIVLGCFNFNTWTFGNVKLKAMKIMLYMLYCSHLKCFIVYTILIQWL